MSTTPAPNRKRTRERAEIASQAEMFGRGWRPGDKLLTWLRKHEGELSRLIAEGWSWADVGKAMFEAGIGYSTGIPVSPRTLRVKMALARKGQAERQTRAAVGKPRMPVPMAAAASMGPFPSLSVPAGRPLAEPRDLGASPYTDVPEEPRFRPVTLAGGRKLPSPLDPPQMKTPPVVVEATDDELIARALGKKPKN